MNLSHYAKLYGPLVVAFLVAAISAFQGTLAQQPLIVGLSVALAIVNVVTTYELKNQTSGVWEAAKAIGNVAHVVLQTILAIVATGTRVGPEQWSIVALAVLGAVTTYIFPNEPKLVFASPEDPRL